MVVENVARISLASRRSSEEQGDLTIGDSLFGQIVIDDKRMLSFVTEVFSPWRSLRRVPDTAV